MVSSVDIVGRFLQELRTSINLKRSAFYEIKNSFSDCVTLGWWKFAIRYQSEFLMILENTQFGSWSLIFLSQNGV